LIRGEVEGPATCYCVDPEGVRWLKDRIESWLPGCCSGIPDLTLEFPPMSQQTSGTF
jgi:hypothetical protein